jgi:hypothetical protein
MEDIMKYILKCLLVSTIIFTFNAITVLPIEAADEVKLAQAPKILKNMKDRRANRVERRLDRRTNRQMKRANRDNKRVERRMGKKLKRRSIDNNIVDKVSKSRDNRVNRIRK